MRSWVVVTMLLLSPSAIQYLPGLECGVEDVEISQAVSLQDKQVLQVFVWEGGFWF